MNPMPHRPSAFIWIWRRDVLQAGITAMIYEEVAEFSDVRVHDWRFLLNLYE